MFGVGESGKKRIGRIALPWQPHWQGMLSDYVTALVWSPDGTILAASSAVGEVVLWRNSGETLHDLQGDRGRSIDAIAFSADGQFLAAAGEEGTVNIWEIFADGGELIATLKRDRAWIDKLAWSPKQNWLAYSIGRQVCVWDLGRREEIVTLDFEQSSALAIAWQPFGEYLAIAGNQGVKIWDARDWDDDPYILDIPTVSVAIAWSPDGKYLACGNMDATLVVVPTKNPSPWVMRGFYGKVRQLTWSDRPTVLGTPLLAAANAEAIVVWEKQFGDEDGWDSWELLEHQGVIQAIGFQPGTFHLASASEDGKLCIWREAELVWQILQGATEGFSGFAWHPQGEAIAAGGDRGELRIWTKSTAGQGFGRT